MLEGLATVIRARFKLFQPVKAVTVEAKWSGWFLSMFPILVIILINLIDPNYYDNVDNSPLFMRAIVNIKV